VRKLVFQKVYSKYDESNGVAEFLEFPLEPHEALISAFYDILAASKASQHLWY
jgi:hypothetical protein